MHSDGKVPFLEADYLQQTKVVSDPTGEDWVRLLRATRGVHNPHLRIAHVRHFVWTSTKNEWNTQNAI